MSLFTSTRACSRLRSIFSRCLNFFKISATRWQDRKRVIMRRGRGPTPTHRRHLLLHLSQAVHTRRQVGGGGGEQFLNSSLSSWRGVSFRSVAAAAAAAAAADAASLSRPLHFVRASPSVRPPYLPRYSCVLLPRLHQSRQKSLEYQKQQPAEGISMQCWNDKSDRQS